MDPLKSLVCIAAVLVGSAATPGDNASGMESPCWLPDLNVEYVACLNQQRYRAVENTHLAKFSENLLYGAVLFNRVLQANDSLFHDPGTAHAELCGTIQTEGYRNQPRALARHIWAALNSSSRHALIQDDTRMVYVAVSCSRNYYVVRLASQAPVRNSKEYELFRHAFTSIGGNR